MLNSYYDYIKIILFRISLSKKFEQFNIFFTIFFSFYYIKFMFNPDLLNRPTYMKKYIIP